MASGANPQTVQLKPTDGFFCQETKTPKAAVPAFPQMLSLGGMGSGGTVGHGEPHELHLISERQKTALESRASPTECQK